MIKVTFCAYDKPDNVGGPVSWIRRLFPLLRSRGIEPRCLFLMHWGENGPALDALRDAGFDCRWTTLDRTEDRIQWILEDLSENPPDVFVPNLVVAAYYAARWAHAAGIPTVGILHSDDPFYRALQSEFVFGDAEYRLDAIVPVSRKLEEEIASLDPRNTIVRRIPYGVTIPEVVARRAPSGLRLAYVGRLVEEQKRISEVVRALGNAVKTVPGTTAVIYGDGPDRRRVEKLLESELAGTDIVLTGLVDSEQMQKRMLDADVIVLLSDYEGLPIALIEAMACGCVPVCLRGSSGIPELVVHEVTGLLVDDRSAGFVSAIRSLSDDPALWSRLSAAAHERALEFSAESSADAWAALFAELHEGRTRSVPVKVPASFALPPVHPGLASADRRLLRSRWLSDIISRSRMLLGKWKRALLTRTAQSHT